MKRLLEKYVIAKYILISYVKTFLISSVIFAAVFVILKLTGLYTDIENALNLQYNSPFILVPLYSFAALAILCFFIGFLVYFYKYKRAKTKSRFYRVFSEILNEKKINQG
jgi:hypothetical protein